LQRVQHVLSTETAVADPAQPTTLPTSGPLGAVEFRNIRFGYDAERPVLDRFNVTIPAGTSVAVVGATGTGKSTITRLMLRFYDVQDGSIAIDGCDIRDIRLSELRHAVGVVFEDTLLFHDTVAANIAFSDPHASTERILAAARLAGADEFVDDLPDGYDTMLGERGFSLSGGQRQRIAIARAVLADPRLLILDDATSAVDPSKEHEIREAMATVMRDRTTIVIAHRPGTIALADKVLLLDDGRVAAEGTHDELIASNARYREVLASFVEHEPIDGDTSDDDDRVDVHEINDSAELLGGHMASPIGGD
jgi:ATP-binding cassette subfamily B protein